jgi:hypothetical protein
MPLMESSDHPLYVNRDARPKHAPRPDLDWGLCDKQLWQCHGHEIVVKEGSTTAMQRVACRTNTGTAILPRTEASEVLAIGVCEKHVGAEIVPLKSTLEATRESGDRSQIGCICDTQNAWTLDR